eukprot:4465654-Amphidinium_carterae.1
MSVRTVQEADFRFALMRIRESAEAIAFYRQELQQYPCLAAHTAHRSTKITYIPIQLKSPSARKYTTKIKMITDR